MSKLLIVTVPKQDVARPPGALAILASCCEQVNFDYEIFDLNLFIYKNYSTETVKKFNTDFELHKFRDQELANQYRAACTTLANHAIDNSFTHIAVSVFTYDSILATYELLLTLKKLNYQGQIIIGGIGVTSKSKSITGTLGFGEYVLDQKLIDYVIYGEGDIAFTELLKGNTGYPGINQKNNVQIVDLDQLPSPSYKKINPSEYFFADEPEILITGSRGCVRDCTFCDVALHWAKYTYKSGQQIANEMLSIWQATGVNKFDFSDSLINGSISNFREFNRELIRLIDAYPGFKPKYKGQFICRPSKAMPEQDYLEMSRAGAENLVVGIESFSESIRDHMRKKFDNSSIDWHFAMCGKYGIKNVLLLLSGYVTETIEDHQTNLDHLKKYQIYALSRTIYAINIAVAGLEIIPGTPLDSEDMGINIIQYTDEDSSLYDQTNLWISPKNPSLTPKERLRRSLEIIKTAYQLGYKILHMDNKIDRAELLFDSVNSYKKSIKINPIE
jgi:radical SAM superfamily enzyme YgiQ (UPF0313 family)